MAPVRSSRKMVRYPDEDGAWRSANPKRPEYGMLQVEEKVYDDILA